MRDDATADALALTLALAHSITSAPGSVLGHEQTNTVRRENTLLHGKTLLVLASHDSENVTIELVSELTAVNLHGETEVVEMLELLLIVNFDELLRTRLRVGKIELYQAVVERGESSGELVTV